jgi:DNA repair protein RecO (recombination protein O)
MATNEAAAPRGRRAAAPLLAYVLHRWDWSETSLIVELFTREQGRLVVAAKGAKRPTSQLRPVLLPFQPLHAVLGKAPADEAAEVLNLRGAEWVGGAPLLSAGALLAGWYLNELLMKLLARQDPHPSLFDAYADALAALALAPPGDAPSEAAALRAFELQLLRETGSLPDLGQETLTLAALRGDAHYALHAETGLAQVRREGLAGRTWLGIEAALAQGGGAALRAACTVAPAELGALRTMLRECLHYHLGHDQLRTRRVWQGVQRLAAAAPEVPAK